MSNKKIKVLVAPMNWGLGHATRCMPIINELLSQDAEVFLASDGRALQLLQKEYPHLPHLHFPVSPVYYNSEPDKFERMLFRQLPRIFVNISREHRQLQNWVKKFNIDAVISDNRFGCWSSQAYSVFMTHQVMVKLPQKIRWLQAPLFRLNHFFINRYHACWVPDFEDKSQNLSGDLSHFDNPIQQQLTFVGPLSRMKKIQQLDKKYDLLVILSGPEPQRTLFEKMLLKQLEALPVKSLVARGVTESSQTQQVNERITITDHLTASQMNEAMATSETIVARAGYSTIMDLAVTGNKAILIPTPGQTEQEYLANRFNEQKIFYTTTQQSLDMTTALQQLDKYTGLQLGENKLIKKAVTGLLQTVNNR